MKSKRIIPCLDVNEGRVVKGCSFVNLRDAGDPIELAKRYDEEGADELVFLDITASSDQRGILIDLVKRTADTLFIPFTVGGGISDIPTIHELLLAGADKVSINTAAIRNPKLIHEASHQFGNQCIVLAIDAKAIKAESDTPAHENPEIAIDENSGWEVYTHGGRNHTGIDAVKWAKYVTSLGAGEILLTSMDQDGQKSGYDIGLTQAVAEAVSVPVIASGGAGALEHISDALNVCDAALLASLLHFQELSISEIKTHCDSVDIPVRQTG